MPADDRVTDLVAHPHPALIALPDTLPDGASLTGMVGLDPVAADLAGVAAVDFDDPDQRRRFTAAAISCGNVATITAYLATDQLTADWPHLALPEAVRKVWEARFGELA